MHLGNMFWVFFPKAVKKDSEDTSNEALCKVICPLAPWKLTNQLILFDEYVHKLKGKVVKGHKWLFIV